MSITTVDDQDQKNISNAVAGVQVAILCLQEDLDAALEPDNVFLTNFERNSDKYEGRLPPLVVKT